VPGPASRRAQRGKIARLAEGPGRLVRKNRYARQIFPTPGSDMTIANKKHYHAASHRSSPMSSSRSRPHGFLAYYEELLAVWTRKLGCRDAAQDLTHDAFVKCLEAGSDHVEQPRAYLHQAARNTAVDGFRREGGHEWVTLDTIAAHPSELGDPVAQARTQQLGQALETALAELPLKCRQVFIWQRLEGLTQAEIAERMGLSKNMVEKYMIRTALHLRERLGAYAPS
jgi:RNA polymerase sigma-70 factor (ECF subfamily)